ncbi:hypothetical protein ACLESD_02395 [Pyxidicoccus sp. 3LFB2]
MRKPDRQWRLREPTNDASRHDTIANRKPTKRQAPKARKPAPPTLNRELRGQLLRLGRLDQCVPRLRFLQGGAVVYMPRPAGGEALFLAEGRKGTPGSLFELLNGLPTASGPVHLPTMRILQGRGATRGGVLQPQPVVTGARRGVHIALHGAERGTVSFEWKQVGKRLTYTWNRREIHVSMDAL